MNIYKITNKINNKIYIGQTYKPINVRFKEHLKGENNPFYGKKHSDETKKKISETQKNMSDDTKKKMSLAKKGKTYEEIYGKEKAKQMKNRIIESNKNRYKNSKKFNINLNGEK